MIRTDLRLVRAEPRPVQWYIDPGWADHKWLQHFINDHTDGPLSGVIVSAGEGLEVRQRALRADATERGLELVLDPRVLEAAHAGGAERGMVARQPWSMGRRMRPTDLRGHRGAGLVRQIAAQVVALGCTAVITPSHYLARGLSDPWWPIDYVLTLRLKRELDRMGRSDILIYYRLAVPAALLRDDPGLASRAVRQLKRLQVDALWLLVHPAGIAHAGPESVRGHLRTCQLLHRLGVPLVFERGGLVGEALTAYGGVGGVATGVGTLESFDVTALAKPPVKSNDDESFGPPQRVHIPELFAYLDRKDAKTFFENRQMRGRYGCQRPCCPGEGPEATLREPKRHALYTKAEQLRQMSQTPEHRRPDEFRASVHQSITGLVQASGVVKALATTMKRLASLDRSLGAASRDHLVMRYDLPRCGTRPARGQGPRPQALG